jgi:DNA-binding transcriptional regulator YiaG
MIAALLFQVGTGGVPTIDSVATMRTSWVTVREQPTEGSKQAADSIATSDRVLLLRRWLSLSVAEAARVLGVQRPTVYAWERGEVPAQRNAERIRAVFDAASKWRALSAVPVGALRRELVTADGMSLVGLLSESSLRNDEIISAMKSLLSMQGLQAARRPRSGSELAQRFGFAPLAPAASSQNVLREAKGRPGWRGDKA